MKFSSVAAAHSHDCEIICAGITTAFNALSVGDIAELVGRAAYLDDMVEGLSTAVAGGNLRAEHRLHLRCEVGFPMLEERLERVGEHEMVGMVSLMDHTPGNRQFNDLGKCKEFYRKKYDFDDTQLERFIELSVANVEKNGTYNTDCVQSLARKNGYTLCSHDDATVEHVEEAVGRGVSIAEFPTTLHAAQRASEYGLAVLVGAPNLIRGMSHSGNVSSLELAEERCLDIVSSDYMPHSLLRAALVVAEVAQDYDFPSAIRAITKTPAERVGLTDRGEIAEGKRADLIRVSCSGPVPSVRAVWRAGSRVI